MANALQLKVQAEASGELLQLVSFTVDSEEYAVDVTRVHEIIRLPQITNMPAAPAYVEGIFNLRGQVIPVISMRERFGLAGAANDGRTRIIVMSVGSQVMGFKVDAVSEVTRVQGGDLQPPPAMLRGAGKQQCFTGVINQSERMLIMLDPEQIFSAHEATWETGLSSAS